MKDSHRGASPGLAFCIRKNDRIRLIGSDLNALGIIGASKVTGSVRLISRAKHAADICVALRKSSAGLVDGLRKELGPLSIAIDRETEHSEGGQFCCLLNAAADKMTIVHLSLSGEPIRISRVCAGARAESCTEEIKLLSAVSHLFPQVPRLLGIDRTSELITIRQSAGPNRSAGMEMTPAHWEFLFQLVGASAEGGIWSRQIDKINAMVSANPGLNSSVVDAVRYLNRREYSIPAVITHGDFAPWNLRRMSDGRIYAFDWENGSANGVPWFDAMHFEFQTHLLIKRSSPARIESALDACLAIGYRFPSGQRILNSEERTALKLLFLTSKFLEASQEEGSQLGQRQRAAFSIIKHAALPG